MAGLGRYIYNTLSHSFWGTHINDMDEQHEETAEPGTTSPNLYQPSIQDVLEVKQLLFDNFKLPLELIDVVVDFAEYWPHTTSVTAFNPDSPVQVRAGPDHENKFLLRTLPIGCLKMGADSNYSNASVPKPWPESRNVPDDATEEVLKRWAEAYKSRGEFACRKIVFTLQSHDQGWGGGYNDKGTYHGSFTWFDVGLERVSAFRTGSVKGEEPSENTPLLQFQPFVDQAQQDEASNPVTAYLRTIQPRTIPVPTYTPVTNTEFQFEHPLLPSRGVLQRNKVAIKDTTEHIITWSCDDNILPESTDGNALETQGRGRDTGTGEFVRNLKIGDVITVWAKARFPQWVNVVERVKVDVYWAL